MVRRDAHTVVVIPRPFDSIPGAFEGVFSGLDMGSNFVDRAVRVLVGSDKGKTPLPGTREIILLACF